MCDPVTIAGVALSGAGTAANSIAANQVSAATNAAEQQTAFQNNILQNRAFAQNKQALGEYSNFAQGQGAMGQKLGDYLAAGSVGRAPPPSQMAPTGASTAAAVTAGAAPTAAAGTQQAAALGNMNSFGDYLAQQNRGAAEHLQRAGMDTDFMRGDNQVLGLQLNDAQHAGDTASLFGGLLGGVGSLATRAGINGADLGGLFGTDISTTHAAQAGLAAGLTRYPDGSIG